MLKQNMLMYIFLAFVVSSDLVLLNLTSLTHQHVASITLFLLHFLGFLVYQKCSHCPLTYSNTHFWSFTVYFAKHEILHYQVCKIVNKDFHCKIYLFHNQILLFLNHISINLLLLFELPAILKSLLDGTRHFAYLLKYFKQEIQQYNATLSFTSLSMDLN